MVEHLVQVHPVKQAVQLYSTQHDIQVNPGDQRIHIQQLDRKTDHSLRNRLRDRLNVLGEPPAPGAFRPVIQIHASQYGER